MTIFGSAGQFISENFLKTLIKSKKCEPDAEIHIIRNKPRRYADNRSGHFVLSLTKVRVLRKEKVNDALITLPR
ncbi:TPA: hypothetical protein JD203_15860 [Cronobacter sakazakii]|nr:hypothetical protein [Cronobacter sakazakii]EGT5653456.1 hypothetical protein [Cronobacter sakazakii]EGT5750891.1 hypothetical protein [Cronobacter sakazakii]EGT5752697.1 hypothetical protein [Cronobacter sakazakii]KAB0824940.1 hypothetical protein FZI24_05760 [Cronobacter sakazakii]